MIKALSKKDKNSVPGEDGIVYEYLQNLPYLHKILATVFTQIRDDGVAPESWSKSNIIVKERQK